MRGVPIKGLRKSMPFTAPSKEEKLLKVNTILREIKEMLDKEQPEVVAVDERILAISDLAFE